MLKDDKLQFPEHEGKSIKVFVEESVIEVFLNRFGIPCITGTILVSLVYLYTVDIVTTRNVFRISQ